MRLSPAVALIAAFVVALPWAPRAETSPPWSADEYAAVAGDLIFAGPLEVVTAFERLKARGQPDVAASLILALRFARFLPNPAVIQALEDVTGAAAGPTWYHWMRWQETTPSVAAHPGHYLVQRRVFEQIDTRFLRFFPEQVAHDIRLEEVTWGGVRLDGIPALTEPALVSAGEAGAWLLPDDPVFGVSINGDARAYPLRIMNWHEMFNDTVGGVPVTLAYCTLCNAGILYETAVEGADEPRIFGSSGFLYRSNKLMYDADTWTLWNQMSGEPVIGPLVGSGLRLGVRPVVISSWADWLARHPDSRVLDINTGFERDYGSGVAYREYFASPDLMFPAVLRDDVLPAKAEIFGIRPSVGGAGGAHAWPLAAFGGGRVIHERIGDRDVLLVGDAGERSVRAYGVPPGLRLSPGVDGDLRVLRGPDGAAYSVTEDALVGPADARFGRLPGHLAFWFAWRGDFADTALYRVD